MRRDTANLNAQSIRLFHEPDRLQYVSADNSSDMAFDRNEVVDLLARCHRRCCICHRFCGVKIETDHIVPAADDGNDDIDNALPVCFDCHAEIHSYNPDHPRGRKFTPNELRAHKERWLQICDDSPERLLPEIVAIR